MGRRALAGAQKGAAAEGRTVVWVDESGFYLLPGRVRTYAPRGQTPILRVRLTRDHLSVIGGVTPDGKLLLRVAADRALRGPDVVRFLEHLLAHVPGKLLVIWDGASIHRGQPVQAFLAAAGGRVRLEQLPGYAPDLNPLDQGVWQHLKHVELANVCCPDLPHLRRELNGAAKRLRRKPHLIRDAIRHAGYEL